MKGTVSSQNGIRVEGAQVEIEGVSRTETDGAGYFLFQDIRAGYSKIEISKRGFPTINRALLVKPDRIPALEIILPGVATPSPVSQMTAVPLIRQGNAIFAGVRIPRGSEVTFLLDTGATDSALSPHLADHLGLRPGPEGSWLTVTTASGSLKAPPVFLPSLAVADFEEKGIERLIMDWPGRGSLEGILDFSLLNRFRFTIDSEENELILRR